MPTRQQATSAASDFLKTAGGHALGAVVGFLAVTAVIELGWADKYKGLFHKS